MASADSRLPYLPPGVVMGEGAEVSKQISDIMLPCNLASLLTLHQVSVNLRNKKFRGMCRDTIAVLRSYLTAVPGGGLNQMDLILHNDDLWGFFAVAI